MTRARDDRTNPESTDPDTGEPVITDPDGNPQEPGGTPIDNPSG